MVRLVFRQQSVGRLRVARQALHLAIGAVGTSLGFVADAGPLVPFHAQPVQAGEDVVLILNRGTGLIGVLEAEDESAAQMAREQIVEERRSGRPQM